MKSYLTAGWFYSVIGGFVLGVLLRSFLDLNIYFVLFLFLVSVAIFTVSKYAPKRTDIFLLENSSCSRQSRSQGVSEHIPSPAIYIAIFITTFALGILRFHSAEISRIDPTFENLIGQSVKFEGVIVDEPDEREKNTKLAVALNKKVKVLITTDAYSEFSYGDKISFSGKLEKPSNFETDTGRIFDYINYLKKDGILFLMKSPEIEIVSENQASKIKYQLFRFKNYFLHKIGETFSPPKDVLLGGILIGARSAIPTEQNQDFITTGIVHIVALSGYNISLVSENIMKILSVFLPYFFSLWSGIFAIILFVLLTGAPSTAVRAGVMAVLVLLSKASGRGHDVTRGLALAGALMILVNPYILVFDVSFQLSFLATIAIIYLAPIVEAKLSRKMGELWGFRNILATTLAAQIFVLPYLLYKMGLFSAVALPVNLSVLPLIPTLMEWGFLSGFAALVSNYLALPFAQIPEIILSYILWVVEKSADLPFAAYNIPNFPLWLTLILYIILFWYISNRRATIKSLKT